MSRASTAKKLTKRLILVAIIIAVIAAPGVVLTWLDFANAVTVGTLAAIAALLPTLLVEWRAGLLATGIIAVATFLVCLVTPSPTLSALVLAGVAALVGYSARRGMNGYLIMVLVGSGFIVAQPPAIINGKLANAAVALAIACAAGAWTVAVAWFIGRVIPKKPLKSMAPRRAQVFAAVLALLIAIATWIVVNWHLGHTGGWLILTIAIVIQPYMQDAWVKTLHRAGGTLLGFAIAYVIGLVLHIPVLIYVAGFIAMFIALEMYINPKRPYWLYVTFLTPAVVLLEGATSVADTAEHRLAATLGGVALAVCAEAILIPIYRRDAARLHLDRY